MRTEAAAVNCFFNGNWRVRLILAHSGTVLRRTPCTARDINCLSMPSFEKAAPWDEPLSSFLAFWPANATINVSMTALLVCGSFRWGFVTKCLDDAALYHCEDACINEVLAVRVKPLSGQSVCHWTKERRKDQGQALLATNATNFFVLTQFRSFAS